MLRGSMAHVSPKADCYSLGSVLYEILTGRIPFQGANKRSVLFCKQCLCCRTEFKSTNNYDQRRDLIDGDGNDVSSRAHTLRMLPQRFARRTIGHRSRPTRTRATRS